MSPKWTETRRKAYVTARARAAKRKEEAARLLAWGGPQRRLDERLGDEGGG